MNKAVIFGYVGRDPEVRALESGVKVANLSIATTERGYTKRDGTVVEDRTEWHNVVAWRGIAEVFKKHVKKGDKLLIEGKLRTRSWEQDGVKRYATDIHVENFAFGGGNQSSSNFDEVQEPPQDSFDDLPF